MLLLFAELGVEVNFYDLSSKNSDALLKHAKGAKLYDHINTQKDCASLYDTLGSAKVFVFSLPHGTVDDSIVESLHPFLQDDGALAETAA